MNGLMETYNVVLLPRTVTLLAVYPARENHVTAWVDLGETGLLVEHLLASCTRNGQHVENYCSNHCKEGIRGEIKEHYQINENFHSLQHHTYLINNVLVHYIFYYDRVTY